MSGEKPCEPWRLPGLAGARPEALQAAACASPLDPNGTPPRAIPNGTSHAGKASARRSAIDQPHIYFPDSGEEDNGAVRAECSFDGGGVGNGHATQTEPGGPAVPPEQPGVPSPAKQPCEQGTAVVGSSLRGDRQSHSEGAAPQRYGSCAVTSDAAREALQSVDGLPQVGAAVAYRLLEIGPALMPQVRTSHENQDS